MELLLDRYPALGTAWWVEAVLPPGLTSKAITPHLLSHLTWFEQRYSRFTSDSLISRLNTERQLKNVDDECIALLLYGQSLYERTHGSFNFLLGDTLVARGYGKGREVESGAALPHPPTALLVDTRTVTLSAGSVDCGGFGKGYLIDELAALLRRHDIEEFLINGGGDIYASCDAQLPITIHLEHPTDTETYIGTTTLLDQGFAASSPYKRVWKYGDSAHTHIVGATKYASFVKAASARDADAFATAALLLDDIQLGGIAAREGIGIARFDPQSQQFSVVNFDFIPLSLGG